MVLTFLSQTPLFDECTHMNLDSLLEQARSAPTIMSLDEELLFVRQLASTSDEVLIGNFDALSGILDILYDSHTGGGIFDVTEDTVGELQTFARQLRRLATQSEARHAQMLNSIAAAFETRF